MWGTDAYTDGSYWWVWNFIQNDPAAPPLVLTWQKAGIYIPIPSPLPHGQAVCRQKVLGDTAQPTPILDQSAPIIYSVNNQTQDAAVFMAAQGILTPAVTNMPGSDHARLILPSIERFATTFQRGDKLVPLIVNISSNAGHYPEPAGADVSNPPKKKQNGLFSLSLDVEPEGLTLAISDLPDHWTVEQWETVETGLRAQGFTVELLAPGKFLGSEFARNLGLPSEIINRSFLVLRNGTKAAVTYSAWTLPERQDAYLIMFDNNGKQPVASEALGITVPMQDHPDRKPSGSR